MKHTSKYRESQLTRVVTHEWKLPQEPVWENKHLGCNYWIWWIFSVDNSELKTPGEPSRRKTSTICGIYLQEPHQVPTIDITENSLPAFGRQTYFDIYQRFFVPFNKACPLGKLFNQSLSDLKEGEYLIHSAWDFYMGERKYSTPAPWSHPVQPKEVHILCDFTYRTFWTW